MANTRAKSVWVRSPQTLYNYRVLAPLGVGGFGEVFKARVHELNRLVALKRFRSGSSGEGIQNWIKEYSLHRTLSHPNVLQVMDAFSAKGFCYIVTELATCSLDVYMNRNEVWDAEGVAQAAMQLSSALHYLHSTHRRDRPVLHRDVTPKNVFHFADLDCFKLGDFGISTTLSGPSDVAVSRVANWAFVAPDLVRRGHTTTQSDLYQLGLVLLCMATGELPVEHGSPGEMAQRIADGEPWKRAQVHNFGDTELKSVVKKLLYRNPAKRYRTAEELHADAKQIWQRLRRLAT